MYAIGRRFNDGTVGHFSALRPWKNSEVSSYILRSLAMHFSSRNGRGLHDLCGHFQLVLIQLFIPLGTLATEILTSDILNILWGGSFLKSLLHQLWLNMLICPHRDPGDTEKTRVGAKNGISLGKSVLLVGTDGFSRRSVTKRFHVHNNESRGCLMGPWQWAGWAWVVHIPWHFFWTLVDKRSSSCHTA